MILSPETYHRVAALAQQLLERGEYVSYAVCEDLGVSRDAVISIYHQAFVKRQKRLTPAVEAKLGRIVKDVENGKKLYDIAKELGFSSYKLAKMVSQHLFGDSFQVLDIASNAGLVCDEGLRADLIRCCTDDWMSSFKSDMLKRITGQEYEEVLYAQLRSKHMCFETEEELRKKGKPKTPDVLFLIPMGLAIPFAEGHVVNWIDSKAMFGDAETYADHLEQIKGYYNRYGPGLIIYWNGHISTLKSNEMVAISDRFPDNWIFPTGEAADGTCPEFLRNSTNVSSSAVIEASIQRSIEVDSIGSPVVARKT